MRTVLIPVVAQSLIEVIGDLDWGRVLGDFVGEGRRAQIHLESYARLRVRRLPDKIAGCLEQFVGDSTVLPLFDPDGDRDIIVVQDHRIFEFDVAQADGVPIKKLPVNSPNELDVKSSRQDHHVVEAMIGEVGE